MQAWTQRLLEAVDVPPEDAQAIASLIVRTEARGLPTHGISRMPTYIDKLKSGEYNARPTLHVEPGAGMLRMNADGAMGQLAGLRAIHECLRHVQTQPAVMCFARDLGHLGAVGMLPLIAAEHGYFALAIQRTAPVLGLPGSTGPLIGHSPIAFAAPIAGQAPLVFDMACSIAARGHVLLAAQKGQAIPEGWAVDADGTPTTDASAAIDGMLLPVGGYKGLGIAMLGEILAGSLASSLDDRAQLREITRGPGAPGGGSAFFWVINPSQVNGTSTFDLLMSDWASHYQSNAGSVARLPGQRAAAAERDASCCGIEIADVLVHRLQPLGQAWGIRFPAAI